LYLEARRLDFILDFVPNAPPWSAPFNLSAKTSSPARAGGLVQPAMLPR
jgi:hypothetical protein